MMPGICFKIFQEEKKNWKRQMNQVWENLDKLLGLGIVFELGVDNSG